MKQSVTFLFAMTVSACIFHAGRMVVGIDEPGIRPLAKSLGEATIDECKVRGRIESRTNGVYAVFDFENPQKDEKTVEFHYLAARIPPMSLMMRMGPQPETVKKGVVNRSVKAGNIVEEVLLKGPDPVFSDRSNTNAQVSGSATGVAARLKMELSPETWTLVVSRKEIKGAHGWGAVGPAASDAIISLDKGEAVLAGTVREPTTK